MAQNPDLLIAGLDRMIRLGALAWHAPPEDSARLSRAFHQANNVFQLAVLAHQRATRLIHQARAVETGALYLRNKAASPAVRLHIIDEESL